MIDMAEGDGAAPASLSSSDDDDTRSTVIRLGLIADTHGWLDPAVVAAFRDAHVDLVVHAGDVGDERVLEDLRRVAPVLAVRGNIDGGPLRFLPLVATAEVGEARVAALHIAGPPGRPNATLRRLVADVRPDVVVVGHSHVVAFHRVDGALVVNPGAAGRVGFHSDRTALVLSRASGGPWQAARLDLGPRGRTGRRDADDVRPKS